MQVSKAVHEGRSLEEAAGGLMSRSLRTERGYEPTWGDSKPNAAYL